MPRKIREYQRLPGIGRRGRGLLTLTAPRSSLWLGADHILAVDSYGYTQQYKRFYYQDVQAILLRKTASSPRRIVLGAIAVLLASAWLPAPPELRYPFAALFAAPFVIALLIDIVRGPSCVCHVWTAVQKEELPSLNRIRAAHKALS